MRRGTVFSILFSFCFLSFAGTVFAAPPERPERKCNDGKDNDGDGQTDCDDSDCESKDVCTGGGDPPVAFPSALDVQWSSAGGVNEISETATRPCPLESNSTANNSATYHCWHVGAPSVFYKLEDMNWTQTARKGDDSFCGVFDDPGLDLNPNSSYQVSWDCSSIPCTVQIINWAFGDEVRNKIPGADTVRLEAYGDASPVWPSDMSPDTIEVTFKKDGTNKTAAKCVWDLNLGNITFSQAEPAVP